MLGGNGGDGERGQATIVQLIVTSLNAISTKDRVHIEALFLSSAIFAEVRRKVVALSTYVDAFC